MFDKLVLLNCSLLEKYKSSSDIDFNQKLNELKPIELPFKFDFHEASAATYSSNIEGNSTSLDSFLKYASSKALKENKEIAEINDLVKAYQFEKQEVLNKKNFLQSHKILSKQFLILSTQGKIRKGNLVIGGKTGIVYVAIDFINLKKEFSKFFTEVEYLLKQNLNIKEAFYFTSLIHLIFEKIHPFNDGNGRAGRLLEKWFLSNFIGDKAWMIESEKNYFENRELYYKNLSISFDYESSDFQKSVPFLLMLPNAL